YQCLIKNIFINQLDEQKRPGIAALQGPVSIFRNPRQVITVVKNRVATFAVLGHDGQIFKQAGILTCARTEVFPA
ncbi:MAG: hypothetical protein WBQ37_00620, partial [Candidatus Competibacter sp.]